MIYLGFWRCFFSQEVETGKKRRVESASKTPVPDKKAKATPQKTGNFLSALIMFSKIFLIAFYHAMFIYWHHMI